MKYNPRVSSSRRKCRKAHFTAPSSVRGGYLHYFTNDWEESNKYLGTGWLNTEARAYTYAAGLDSNDEEANLEETMKSRIRRGKKSPMIGKDLQEKLCVDGHQAWEDAGLVNALKI